MHATQNSINCTILWVGEGCKEMQWGHSISESKRIQRVFQTSLNITPTPGSWFGLNFFPFLFPRRYLLRCLRHFQHPIFLEKFCLLFENRNCCSLKHDKYWTRDGISGVFSLFDQNYVSARCWRGREVCQEASLAPMCQWHLDSDGGFSNLVG